LLILIGTSTDLQLLTIVSRCQVVHFAPLPEALVAELLRGQGIQDAALVSRVARLSGGSPGLARALADPELWKFRRNLVLGLTTAQVDSVGLAEAWWKFVGEAGKETAAQRQRASLVLRLVIDFLHDALRLKLGGKPQLADPQERHALETLAGRADEERLLGLLERALEASTQIERRNQLVLVLEALLDALREKLTV
jgi:DNA polymerase-3 subunit delta'